MTATIAAMRPADDPDPTLDEGTPDQRLHSIDERVKNGDPKGALYRLFELLHRWPTHSEGLRRTAELTDQLGAPEEAALFRAVLDNPHHPQALYDLGYLFVETRFPAIGAEYLKLCLEAEPDHPLVKYELAFARYSLGDYADALHVVEELIDRGDLAGSDEFAAALLRIECLVFLGRLDEASEVFERIDVRDAAATGEAQLDAVANLISRARAIGDRVSLTLRDWHFIENGSGLLHAAADASEMFLPFTTGVKYLAGMLRRLERFILTVGDPPEQVQYIGEEMFPLAVALGRRFGAEVVEAGDGEPCSTLVLAVDPDRCGPHLAELRKREEEVDLFTLFLDPRREYPIVPDVTGQFAAELTLPWQGPGMAPSPRAGDEILAAMLDIVDDEDDLEAIAAYYRPIGEHLVYGNYERYPARRTFTPLRRH